MSKRIAGKTIGWCHAVDTHECDYCKYEVKSERAIRLHLKYTHGLEMKGSKEKTPSCYQCRKMFESKKQLEKHLKR